MNDIALTFKSITDIRFLSRKGNDIVQDIYSLYPSNQTGVKRWLLMHHLQ
jgi:hypothetical protein